jgi:hypothetical protein
MPRGGKTKGSGRKPVPYWIKLRVGAFCEDCYLEERKRQASDRHEARRDIKAIRRAQEHPRQIRERVQKRFRAPPQWRRQLRNLFDSKMERPLGRLGHVSAQIEKLGRYRSAPLKRPKGVRSKILKEAAEKFRTIDYEGKKYHITVDVADKYWKIFRKHARRLISSRNGGEAPPKRC